MQEFLSSYAMKSGETLGRQYDEPRDSYRNCYQRDRDRIIHSTAFRRLEYKTQVFVNHEGDYYRTRLTHTIEVNQIARTIARALNINEDLVDAISLAHDIGHTPFGHAGEEALNELMQGRGGFEHNAQGLRVVDKLERRYPEFRGLNLSYEVREGIIRHLTEYDVPRVEGSEFLQFSSPTLEAQVINVADEIAYNSHDLDDGLKSGYIMLDELKEVELWDETYCRVKSKLKNGNKSLQIYGTIRELINLQVTDVIKHTESITNELSIKTVDDVRAQKKSIIELSQQQMKLNKELKKWLHTHLYQHYKVIKICDKAKRYIEALFNVYTREPRQLPPDFQAELEYTDKEQCVCDYIAGMTDRYAQDEYEKLFIPYIKM